MKLTLKKLNVLTRKTNYLVLLHLLKNKYSFFNLIKRELRINNMLVYRSLNKLNDLGIISKIKSTQSDYEEHNKALIFIKNNFFFSKGQGMGKYQLEKIVFYKVNIKFIPILNKLRGIIK